MTSDELRKILESRGLSQREMARRLDMDDRTFRRYCAGGPIPWVVAYAVYWVNLTQFVGL